MSNRKFNAEYAQSWREALQLALKLQDEIMKVKPSSGLVLQTLALLFLHGQAHSGWLLGDFVRILQDGAHFRPMVIQEELDRREAAAGEKH